MHVIGAPRLYAFYNLFSISHTRKAGAAGVAVIEGGSSLSDAGRAILDRPWGDAQPLGKDAIAAALGAQLKYSADVVSLLTEFTDVMLPAYLDKDDEVMSKFPTFRKDTFGIYFKEHMSAMVDGVSDESLVKLGTQAAAAHMGSD